MSDRCKSTPIPPTPPPEPPSNLIEPDLPVLRETYACQVRREDRELLERLAESLLELTREASVFDREIDHGGIEDDLAAVVVDLRFLENYLAYTGRQDGNILERWQARLADAAERLVPKVAEIAGELEAAIQAAEASQ